MHAHSVARWMTRAPITMDPDAAALEALERMEDGDFRHLPVVECGGRLVGILSIDDLRAALPFQVTLDSPRSSKDRYAALEYVVGELMTYAPFTASPDEPLRNAVRRMAARALGCLPVVDRSGTLLGILTETDALFALIELEETAEEAAQEEAEKLVDEIGRLARQLRSERAGILAQLGRRQEAEQALTAAQREAPMDVRGQSSNLDTLRLTGALADRAARRLAAIDAALDRHERAELGSCQDCRGRISPSRLRALPGTACCLRCARASAALAAGRPPFSPRPEDRT